MPSDDNDRDRDRDVRLTKNPPDKVRTQIAPPLRHSRAATPVEVQPIAHTAEVSFHEPTNVGPAPTRANESTEARMRRQVAETKNMNVEQLGELEHLRQRQEEFFDFMVEERKAEAAQRLAERKAEAEARQKDADARRQFRIRMGLLIVALGTALVGLIKVSGCG